MEYWVLYHSAKNRKIFQEKYLELFKATLSQNFVTRITVEAYYWVDFYYDVFFSKVIAYVVLLTSTYNSCLPEDRTACTEAWIETENGWVEQENELFLSGLTNHVHPERRLVFLYTELHSLQRNFL